MCILDGRAQDAHTTSYVMETKPLKRKDMGKVGSMVIVHSMASKVAGV